MKPYIRSLDALRTFAALLVILVHLSFPTSVLHYSIFQHCELAVDFFFVLSGFVIAINYWDIAGPRQVWRYLRSRFARIYPLHLLTLLVWLGIEVIKYIGTSRLSLASSSPAFSENNGWSFTTNLLLFNAHGLTQKLAFNLPSWSIGAEASCYMLFAIILLLSANPIKRIIMIVLLCALASLFFPRVDITTFGVFRAIYGFALGCAWWIMIKNYVCRTAPAADDATPTKPLFVINGLCLIFLGGGMGLIACSLIFPGIHLVALGVIGLCACNPSNAIMRMLEKIGSGWFGQVSYGVYLWHGVVVWIASRFLTLLIGYPSSVISGARYIMCPEWVGNIALAGIIMASLAVAHVSYTCFENPWRKQLRPPRPDH